MTERQDRPPGDDDARDSLRLSPPPKVDSIVERARSEAAERAHASPRSSLYWLTAAVFLLLGAMALAVFVYLPGWVAHRSAAASVSEVAADLPRDAQASADEDLPSQPLSQTPPAETEAPAPATSPVPSPEPALRDDGRRPMAAPPPLKAADPAQTAFAQAMAEGLSRLEQGELEDARRAFERALTLAPASHQAADGVARVEAAQQLVAIADHRERAEAFEEQERWTQAAAEYAAVLALDPAIRFARQGRARSSARHQLAERLDSHLARPDRLSSDAVLEEARRLLVGAREIDSPGPVLRQQIERLGQQIVVASTPVRVLLLSDGFTDVLVYRVGRLGAFERREIDLRPGTYTVVGRREGYRDVRHRWEVAPDGSTVPLTVRCEEEI